MELVALTRLTGGGTGGALAGYQERSKNTGVHCDTANTVTTPLIIRNTKHGAHHRTSDISHITGFNVLYNIKKILKENNYRFSIN